MKRLHVHVAVENLNESIQFYSTLFSGAPDVVKQDYAKWMLEDPRVNFAISTGNREPGLDHLGIQAESENELNEIHARLESGMLPSLAQEDTACCYAKSDKYWTVDPQGIAWETFHTFESIAVFGNKNRNNESTCCAPNVTEIKPRMSDKEEECCEPKAGCC